MGVVMSIGRIYSALGNSNSLLTLGVKDVSNSLGLTAGSYITGDAVEGKDRFIDEFGTEAIWLFGIPVFKRVLDLGLFKPFKLDSNIDVRIFKNPEIFEKAKEFAPTQEIKNALEHVSNKQKMFKGMYVARFALSTLLTTAAYFGLTKARHKYTEKQIEKDYFKRQDLNKKFTEQVPFSSSFAEVHKAKQPSFTGGGLAEFMFNPLKNLMLVDGVITGERFTHARNKQDFVGYVVKEGAFWTFVYFAGDKIKHGFENLAKKRHNKSIDLDSRVYETGSLKDAFKDGSLEKSLKEFPKNGSDVEIYEFINKNPNNFVVKASKMSDIIPTLKKSDVIDTRKYIDINDVKSVAAKLEKLKGEFEVSGEDLDNFLNSVKKLKRGSVLKNLGTCIGVLGVLVPLIMIAIRFANKDNQEFQTKKEVEARLAGKN